MPTPEGGDGTDTSAQNEPGGSSEGERPAEAPADGEPARPILKLRSRRRRRRPAMPGLTPGPAANEVSTGSSDDGTTPATARPMLAPGQRSFSVPRRRRRQLPLSAAPTEAGATGAEPSGDTATPGGAFIAPARRRRRRRPAAAAVTADGAQVPQGDITRPGGGRERARRSDSRDGTEGAATTRRDDRGERPGGRREGGQRDRRDDRGNRGERRGPPGRGRAGPPRPIERKLYSTDAIVDRGFEDVDEEDGTRRVHWNIVKRTTADQISRKALSAVYVLQREGADSEFPSLGAARAAVNKNIVHPEKLTRSKAEHAAERAGKK
jgi:hypothetical protein